MNETEKAEKARRCRLNAIRRPAIAPSPIWRACGPTDEEKAQKARNSFEIDDEGKFFWKVPHGPFGTMPAGKVAGCISRGYRVIGFGGRLNLAHHISWLMHYDEWPRRMLDHINGNRDDNRPANLRLATAEINAQNQQGAPRHNTSGIRGVSWDRTRGKWMAKISIGGRGRNLGRFNSIEEATAAYEAARAEHHKWSPKVKK